MMVEVLESPVVLTRGIKHEEIDVNQKCIETFMLRSMFDMIESRFFEQDSETLAEV